MGRLEYDDSAFAYFSLSVLVLIFVPLTYKFIASLFSSEATAALQKKNWKPRTTAEAKNLEKVRNSETAGKKFASCGTFMKFLFLCAGWILILKNFANTGTDVQIQSFDPFEILQLETSATDKQIKKQFRKLSIEWHPDRWIKGTGDEQAYAEMMFMKITKAQEALTDPVAKENWIKYGNPDGKQPMELSLGLPSFLLLKENHNLVLVIYLLILVIVIPAVVGVYYSNSKKYSDKLILRESYQIYAFLLKNVPMKYMPEVLALSAEYREMPLRAEDEAPLTKLKKHMISLEMIPKKPSHNATPLFKKWPQTEKVLILLHAHMNRLTDDLPPQLASDVDTILRKSPPLVEAMMDVAKTTYSLRMVQRINEFNQYLVQAIWLNMSSLQQLPHFGSQESKHAVSGKNSYRSLQQFVEAKPLDEAGRKKGMANFTEEQVKDVEKLVKFLPVANLKVEAGCMDYEDDDKKVIFEEKCAAGDILTFYVELERVNKELDESELGIAHTPLFPLLVNEQWTVTLGKTNNEENMFSLIELTEAKPVLRHKMQVPTQNLPPGTYSFDIYLTSNCYLGLDQKKTVKVELVDPATVQPVEVHPEDLEAEKAPGLFDELFPEEEVDSDFADSDDEDDDKKKIEGKKGHAVRKKTSKDEQDDDLTDGEDSDDDLVAVELVDGKPVESKKNK